jgi:hypothetical protein
MDSGLRRIDGGKFKVFSTLIVVPAQAHFCPEQFKGNRRKRLQTLAIRDLTQNVNSPPRPATCLAYVDSAR